LKTIIQLLIAALIVNACVRGGAAALRYYTFKDAVEQEARFGGKSSTSALQQRILEIAAEHEIEVDPLDVVITRDGQETSVAAAYLEAIELVPRLYVRQQLFEFEVSVHPTRPLTVDDIR
jgi:hypothetical protein